MKFWNRQTVHQEYLIKFRKIRVKATDSPMSIDLKSESEIGIQSGIISHWLHCEFNLSTWRPTNFMWLMCTNKYYSLACFYYFQFLFFWYLVYDKMTTRDDVDNWSCSLWRCMDGTFHQHYSFSYGAWPSCVPRDGTLCNPAGNQASSFTI